MDIEKIILIIIGAFVGFFASVLKDYFVEKTKRKYKEIELKREKVEELYILLESWANLFFSQKNHLTLVMQEHISFNDYLDYIIEGGDKNKQDFKRIDMLINIYFKELSVHHKKIIEQMGVVNDIQFQYKQNYQNGNINGEEYIEPLLSETLKVTKLVDKLKENIVVLVNNIK